MDRSVDSIGSCSLDVDAESSDISDTSESLNFPTPLSIKDVTREFTANIRERCTVHKIQTLTTFIDPMTSKIRTELTQQPAGSATSPGAFPQIAIVDSDSSNPEKKPSYLSLACCVNGYSNLTTYDSKIRQDINKSREVSPIRPSTNSIQFCKNSKSLTPPVLEKVPAQSYGNPAKSYKSSAYLELSPTDKQQQQANMEYEERPTRSFVQQRVERLYGPGALAQGFYKQNSNQKPGSRLNNSNSDFDSEDVAPVSELSQKFKQLSPSKNYSNFRKKLSENGASPAAKEAAGVNGHDTSPHSKHAENNSIDLPVLRHLSREFRAQLPIVSPKHSVGKNASSQSPSENSDLQTNGGGGSVRVVNAKAAAASAQRKILLDEVDHDTSLGLSSLSAKLEQMQINELSIASKPKVAVSAPVLTQAPAKNNAPSAADVNANQNQKKKSSQEQEALSSNSKQNQKTSEEKGEKDGHHFLRLLKTEQNRLLALADETEENLNSLMNNPEITEDVLGLLRSASGKARLLVSQKMKQFEGLCHKNLNDSPGEDYVTKADDLQGFWDMVYLQVDEIDSQFARIQAIKSNGWKNPQEAEPAVAKPAKSNKTSKSKASSVSNSTNGTPATKMPNMSASAMKRESQRKQLMEMKRKKKLEMELAAKLTAAAEVSDELHGDGPATNGAVEKAGAAVQVLASQNDS